MARMFLVGSLLKEARQIDVHETRSQARRLRQLPFLSGNDDFVRVYRLSEDLIKLVEDDISYLLPTVQRRGRALPKRTKVSQILENMEIHLKIYLYFYPKTLYVYSAILFIQLFLDTLYAIIFSEWQLPKIGG